MPLNIGYIEGTLDGESVVVRIYYDNTQPASPDQPLINGPRGFCLDMKNTSGRNAQTVVAGVTDTPLSITIGQGDPVTAGPASGRSRTAAQMAALGFTTRGSVGNFQLGPA